MNWALRSRLDKITLDLDVGSHRMRIEELRHEIPHTIDTVECSTPCDCYTCAVYAFELVDDPTYRDVASFGLQRTFAGKEFVDYLLANGSLSAKPAVSAQRQDLILYFCNDEFKHVGRMRSPSRVISKWGTGLLYEHGIWEVPASYGENIRYYAGQIPMHALISFFRMLGVMDFNSTSERECGSKR